MAFQNHSECLSTFQKFKGGVMDVQKQDDLIKEVFEIEAEEIGFCLDQLWGDYENPYENSDTALAFNLFKKGWLAKAQAVPEKTVKLHLVWNENKDECVGFLDSKDARYTATGDDRGMFGVTALGDYFRDLNDERNEFETQIVMIETQEPAND